jgi:hypothetical protein
MDSRRKKPTAPDHLTAQETYLDNALRRQMRAPIKAIALKKVPGTSGYEVQLTITSGNEEQPSSSATKTTSPPLLKRL